MANRLCYTIILQISVLSDTQETGAEAPAAVTYLGNLELKRVEKLEYRGPVIYRNFKIDMVLFPGGYVTIGNDNAVTFHYYTQDYLGSNRAVVNGSTGAVEQTIAYYPYGGVIADLGSGYSGQLFMFGGKELISANGIHEYDFCARRQYSSVPQFTSIDKYCEKYYHLSPYVYCGGNPIDRVDINGDSIAVLNVGGNIGHFAMLIQNADNKWSYYSKNGDKFFNNSKGVSGGKGYHDKGEKSFDSPEQFLSSDYNRTSEKKDEIESDVVNNYDFKEAIVLPTSKKQDNIAKDAQAVYSALKAIGINPAVKRSISYSQGMSANMYTAPICHKHCLITL